MRVWIDISNAPHTLLFNKLASEFEEVLVTAREYNGTKGILDWLGLKAIMVGKYGGGTLIGKLKASIEREAGLVSIVEDFNPEVSIAKHSVEAARISYGLGIPHVTLFDNEQAFHILRLTAPLAQVLLLPTPVKEAIYDEISPCVPQIVEFNGFFELEHTRKFTPNKRVLDVLGLEEGNYIIARPEAVSATYVNGARSNIMDAVHKLSKYYDVLVYPRGKGYWVRYFRGGKEVSILPKVYDSLSLIYYALAVISAGGTMNREAISLGTPAISMYPKHPIKVDEWLIKEGVLFRELNPARIVELIGSIARSRDDLRKSLLSFTHSLELPPLKGALKLAISGGGGG